MVRPMACTAQKVTMLSPAVTSRALPVGTEATGKGAAVEVVDDDAAAAAADEDAVVVAAVAVADSKVGAQATARVRSAGVLPMTGLPPMPSAAAME